MIVNKLQAVAFTRLCDNITLIDSFIEQHIQCRVYTNLL